MRKNSGGITAVLVTIIVVVMRKASLTSSCNKSFPAEFSTLLKTPWPEPTTDGRPAKGK